MKRVESLDILRAFAALSVFFYHIKVVGNDPFNGFFNLGGIGVDLFFVLSGFFIGLSIIKSKTWNAKEFFKRRFMRIAPAYYVSLIIMLALVTPPYILTINGVVDLLSHLSFLHSLSYHTHGSINGSYWSLGIEVYFYILMAASALLLRNKQWRVVVLFVWVFIAWGWRYWVTTLDMQPIFKFILSSQLPGMLDEFVYGIAVAMAITSDRIRNIIENKKYFLISIVLSIYGVVSYLPLQANGNYWSDWSLLIFGRSLLALSFALMVTAFISLSKMHKVNNLIHYTGIPFVGKISYSLYLYHLPVIIAMKNAGILANNNIVAGLFCLLVCLLLSTVSYYFVEKRCYSNC